MRAAEIRVHLRKQPFDPIRVVLSDGSFYDVRHPEVASEDVPNQRELVIGLASPGAGMPERSACCDPVHVTRVEPPAAN